MEPVPRQKEIFPWVKLAISFTLGQFIEKSLRCTVVRAIFEAQNELCKPVFQPRVVTHTNVKNIFLVYAPAFKILGGVCDGVYAWVRAALTSANLQVRGVKLRPFPREETG